ncbi:MAG: RecQ family ATP-dependent DNA helicase, partial [archaeon]|nr:RecQ family ATP-dependent DNA helicase [archaeon]
MKNNLEYWKNKYPRSYNDTLLSSKQKGEIKKDGDKNKKENKKGNASDPKDTYEFSFVKFDEKTISNQLDGIMKRYERKEPKRNSDPPQVNKNSNGNQNQKKNFERNSDQSSLCTDSMSNDFNFPKKSLNYNPPENKSVSVMAKVSSEDDDLNINFDEIEEFIKEDEERERKAKTKIQNPLQNKKSLQNPFQNSQNSFKNNKHSSKNTQLSVNNFGLNQGKHSIYDLPNLQRNGDNTYTNHKLADLSEWQGEFEWDEDVDMANVSIFGYHTFRPNQREIINANLAGRDIFVCMPTGGGKSLTFQIPAIIQQDKVTLVVMPLLSLIQDQTSYLNALGIHVIFLNMDPKEILNSYDAYFNNDCDSDNVKMIFLTPEKIAQSQRAVELLKKLYADKKLARAAIDECHCVCKWGQEFRPDYLHLKSLKSWFPDLPILAVTATATNKVREDVINQLAMKNTLFFRSSFNRQNLFIEVRNKKEVNGVEKDISEFIKNEYPNDSGLIYCATKKHCEELYETLSTEYRIKCGVYHASIKEADRADIHEKWKNNDIKVIIATVAFGMGINKSDVRYVIHFSMPRSFESYYQEIGRAGRDGEKAKCILYYAPGDRKIQEFLLKSIAPKLRSESLRQITEMVDFCEDQIECRRTTALTYFDEKFERKNCNSMCDNCEYIEENGYTVEEKDVSSDCEKILKVLIDARAKVVEFTVSSLAEYLRGTAKGKRFNDKNNGKNLGILQGNNEKYVKSLIRKLIIKRYIDEELKDAGNKCYSIIKSNNAALAYVNNPTLREKITILSLNKNTKKEDNSKMDSDVDMDEAAPKKKKKKAKKKAKNSDGNGNKSDEDIIDPILYGYSTKSQFNDLYEKLKNRRKEILDQENERIKKEQKEQKAPQTKNLSILDIFPENGLKELCRKLPETEDALNMGNINGVALNILKKYGKFFLDLINEHIAFYQINKEDPKFEAVRNLTSKVTEANKKLPSQRQRPYLNYAEINNKKELQYSEKKKKKEAQGEEFDSKELDELMTKFQKSGSKAENKSLKFTQKESVKES